MFDRCLFRSVSRADELKASVFLLNDHYLNRSIYLFIYLFIYVFIYLFIYFISIVVFENIIPQLLQSNVNMISYVALSKPSWSYI